MTKHSKLKVKRNKIIAAWFINLFFPSDGRRVRLPGQRLLSNRTVRCLTNVEALSLRAANLEEVTILFTRFLRSLRVQGALRSFPCLVSIYIYDSA